MDGAESVRSGRSDRSERSHRGHSNHNRHHNRPQQPASRPPSHRGRSGDRYERRDRDCDERSVTIKTPGPMSGDEEEERIEVQVT